MKYDFDQIQDRLHSDSIKWNYYEADVLPMWVADMDFKSPEPVIRALRTRIDHGVYGYPLGIGADQKITELHDLIVSRMEDLYKWQITPQDLVFLPGVNTGFQLACHTLAAPSGAVLVQTPVYPPILNAAVTTGCKPQYVELTRNTDSSYAVDWGVFKSSITNQTRLFILCNPHNPVGTVFQRAELERFAQECLRRNVVICADEIHAELIFQGHQHIPLASLDPEIARQTITLIAPSKTFNLAGLQFSVAIIQNPELRREYLQARKGLVSWVNLMGQVAARAAYSQGYEWLVQLMEYLHTNRATLHEFVTQELPGIKMFIPEATYLAWLDCRDAGITGNPYEFFLNKARVAFNDGETFGQGGQGFVRLNFACPRSVLLDGLTRIKSALVQ